MAKLAPFYQQVQAHYDLSNDFFSLFLDPTRTYSCAYFEPETLSLEEAQYAKIDLALGKIDLRPGQRILDIGCGWGATARRAAERFGVDAIGLTLSQNQFDYVKRQAFENPVTRGSLEFHLQGWEEFEEPVDRIVSIGAFEHFRQERYSAFFDRCRSLLPSDGKMLLHTIVWPFSQSVAAQGKKINHEQVLFAKFIRKHIFPGGQLCPPESVINHASAAGFEVLRVHSLQQHYARTLSIWADRLQARKKEAIRLTSQETYDIYRKYLTGCSEYFANGLIDVMQFSLTVR